MRRAATHDLPPSAALVGPRSDWLTLKRLGPYFWRYRWRMVAALVFLVGAKVANVSVPVLLKTLVDELAIAPGDVIQLVLISTVTLTILLLKWRDLMVVFFDETHARTIGLHPNRMKALFFTLLAASTVAAMQTVGAFLVIALVVTPGATAYLLTDRFPRLIVISVVIGTTTSAIGAYASFFLDGATGGIIVTLQTLIFLAAFVFAPIHGLRATRRRARAAVEGRT